VIRRFAAGFDDNPDGIDGFRGPPAHFVNARGDIFRRGHAGDRLRPGIGVRAVLPSGCEQGIHVVWHRNLKPAGGGGFLLQDPHTLVINGHYDVAALQGEILRWRGLLPSPTD